MMADIQAFQPDLVKSPTDEDDDSHGSAVGKGHEKAIQYLLRYETMVRQQEAEDMATLAHVRPLLKRIEALGGGRKKETPPDVGDIMAREVTFVQLQRALELLDYDSSEIMTTDRQFMLVLRTLAKKSPETDQESISWAEFYQCYKTVVTGMQTLQYVPTASVVRSRTKDRTLSLLSLFEPTSTNLFHEDAPRSIDMQAEEALLGNRKSVLPGGVRSTKKRSMLLFLAGLIGAAALLFAFSAANFDLENHKVTFHVEEAISQVQEKMNVAKSAASTWLPKSAIDNPVPSVKVKAQPHSPQSFTQSPMIVSKVESPTRPVITCKEDEKSIKMLAGATGVAVSPYVLGAARLLQTTGLGPLGAVTLFTVVLAPVMNGIGIVIRKLLRAIGIRKKC